MIDKSTLRLIDDETLEKHIVKEFFNNIDKVIENYVKTLEDKYGVEICVYGHSGIQDIIRNVPYYHEVMK